MSIVFGTSGAHLKKTEKNIRPEYVKALAALQTGKAQNGPWVHPSQLITMYELLPTDFSALSNYPFSVNDLPSEEFWTWNQSSKSQTHVCGSEQVKMVKLMPRLKRRSGEKRQLPRFKAWVMTTRGHFPVHFIWVERGLEQVSPSKHFNPGTTLALDAIPLPSMNPHLPQSSKSWPGARLEPSQLQYDHPMALTMDDLSFLGPWIEF